MCADVTRMDEVRARLDREIWLGKLARRGERVVGDERNVMLAFRHAPELVGLIRFNEFAQQVEFTRPPPWREVKAGAEWTDDDDTGAIGWLQAQGVGVRQRHVVSGPVTLLAKEAIYHPVRNYLGGLKWDGVPRLQIWLADYLNAQANPEYLNAVGRKFLISAVARIEHPGCQVDHVLVLEGPQDMGKSRTARALAVHPEWFTDDMPDVHSKEAALQVCGRWIVELAELAALRRSEIEAMKAFLSRPTDVYRPPYARRAVTVPRQNAFIGTINDVQYLRDPTGNRRFWPVRCGHIDLDALERDRDQLWAEALEGYKAGEVWHLTPAESALTADEQAQRVLVTVLESSVIEYLAAIEAAGIRETDMRSAMIDALRLDPGESDFVERAGRLGPSVVAAMQSAGWQKIKTTGRGKDRRNIYGKLPRNS
jgi:putative DNA primase/helicase